MPVRLTTGLEFSLLRTPVADENGGGPVSPAMAKAKGQTLRLTGQIIDLVQPGRLPTPNTMDHLPARTPEKIAESKKRSPAGYSNLREHVVNKSWGQYEPAIRRWETIIGRKAPDPTIPDGREGQERLSPLLTEWMMGLPEGWITSPEIGISRNDQIKAAGNGVVPQQAVLALRYLLGKVNNG